MKKLLTVFLVIMLIAALLFFWKGAHHALFLGEVLEEWLDADVADQSLTIQIQSPGFSEGLKPEVQQWTLSADSFWMEYGDRRIVGMTAGGVTAYIHGGNLYMDTGRAYALPKLTGLRDAARELALGLLLHGRITKTGDTYHLDMETDQLDLTASVRVDRGVRTMTVQAILPHGKAVHLTLTPRQTTPHPIPQTVADSMVRAAMEPPMPLTEPLEALLPAMEGLLPLSADAALRVECGILELSENVAFTMDEHAACLERNGVLVTIDLPGELSGFHPISMGLLLLRNGEFTQEEDASAFHITLPPETTGALCSSLIPQIGDLGVTFGQSDAVLTIRDGKLTAATLSAEGSVPFLITTIPISFSAEFDIR